MSEFSELLNAMGERIAHSTATKNLTGIHKQGLLTPAELAQKAGVSPENLVLRKSRMELDANGVTAVLNHQLPIAHGLSSAIRMLDGHSPESWAKQLDHRVFFWPKGGSGAFSESLKTDVETTTLLFDTKTFLERLFDRIDFSPINSGNFKQGGANAERGDWLYVPATDGVRAFRENRRNRGLKKSPDKIVEISVRGAISTDDIAAMLLSPVPNQPSKNSFLSRIFTRK